MFAFSFSDVLRIAFSLSDMITVSREVVACLFVSWHGKAGEVSFFFFFSTTTFFQGSCTVGAMRPDAITALRMD